MSTNNPGNQPQNTPNAQPNPDTAANQKRADDQKNLSGKEPAPQSTLPENKNLDAKSAANTENTASK